jgi:hypothetical protein
MIFRQVQASRRIIAIRPLFLYCSWQLCCLCPLFSGVPLALILYPREARIQEGNQDGYNMISIRTLSLLAYFTYIFIDIIIYTLGSMP